MGELVRPLLSYGTSSLVSKVASLFLIPFLTRSLSTSDYGVLSLGFVLNSSVLVVFGGLAESGFMRAFDQAQGRRAEDVQATTLGLWLISGALFGVPLLIISPWIAAVVVGSDEYAWLVCVVVVWAWLECFNTIGTDLMRLQNQPVRYAVVSVARLAITIVCTVALVAWMRFGVAGAVAGSFAGSIAAVILVGGRRQNGWLRWPSLDRVIAGSILRVGIPFIPTNAFGWVLAVGDRILLGRLAGLEAVALYSLGYKVGLLINDLWVTPGMNALGPYILRNTRTTSDRERLAPAFSLFVGFGLLAVLGLAATADAIVAGFAPAAYAPAVPIIPLVALSYVGYGSATFLGWVLYAEGRTASFPVLTAAAAIVNIGANLLLIPSYGIVGAAMATLLGYLMLAVLYWRLAQPLVAPIVMRRPLVLSLLACLSLASWYALRASGVSWFIAGPTVTAAWLVAAVAALAPSDRAQATRVLVASLWRRRLGGAR